MNRYEFIEALKNLRDTVDQHYADKITDDLSDVMVDRLLDTCQDNLRAIQRVADMVRMFLTEDNE